MERRLYSQATNDGFNEFSIKNTCRSQAKKECKPDCSVKTVN